MDERIASVKTVAINGPDDLREVTRGSDVEIVQLKPGKLQGSIRHWTIGQMEISLGSFSSQVRIRGVLQSDKVVVGTMLDSEGVVTQCWKEAHNGDVWIIPPLAEVDAIHGGGAKYVALSLPMDELLSRLDSEENLADPAFWLRTPLSRINPAVSVKMLREIKGIISAMGSLADHDAQGAHGFERSIFDAFMMGLTAGLPASGGQTGARLVSEAEDYILAHGPAVDVSELCRALKVSRRSLHRAFRDTLGVGPAAYLRRRRLSEIQSILRRCDSATMSIGDLAFKYGFPEPSRFAAYYRAHFGERPSETRRLASARRAV